MSNVATSKLGTAEQLRDADILLIRKMYGCGKALLIMSIHFQYFNLHFILDLNYTTAPPPPCENKAGDTTCGWYADYCKGMYEGYMTKWCKKTCNKC